MMADREFIMKMDGILMHRSEEFFLHTMKFPMTVHRTAMTAMIPMIIFSVKLYTDSGG